MQLPEKSSIQYRRTSKAREEGGKMLVTGPPGSGKTRLVAELAKALVGPDQTFLMDWPEEGGTGTLEDLDIPYFTFTTQAQLDTVYGDLVKTMKPKAIIIDSAPSMYEQMMKMRAPSGIPPEDHGKTWRAVEVDFKREVTRFKLLPGLEWFFMTSLVWPDKDETTGVEGKNLVVIPGKLKANVYGLFDIVCNIAVSDGQGGSTIRSLELNPTSRTVAKLRVPPSVVVPPRVSYDLLKTGVTPILNALKLKAKEA